MLGRNAVIVLLAALIGYSVVKSVDGGSQHILTLVNYTKEGENPPFEVPPLNISNIKVSFYISLLCIIYCIISILVVV